VKTPEERIEAIEKRMRRQPGVLEATLKVDALLLATLWGTVFAVRHFDGDVYVQCAMGISAAIGVVTVLVLANTSGD
jgi:hypothetical protein